MFMGQGPTDQELPTFTIINDTIPLETTEQYNLSLRYPSITNDVTLGPDTIIHIIDDDGKPKSKYTCNFYLIDHNNIY